MEYISTRNTEKIFSFDEVFIKGLAPDGGLFVPKKIPILSPKEILSLTMQSYQKYFPVFNKKDEVTNKEILKARLSKGSLDIEVIKKNE